MSYYDDDVGPGTIVAIALGVIVMIGASGWGIYACNVAQDATLGKVSENVRRQNFEETESYRAGLRRDFDELMLSYAHAKSDDERSAIVAVIRHRAEGAPTGAVPMDVTQFLKEHSK